MTDPLEHTHFTDLESPTFRLPVEGDHPPLVLELIETKPLAEGSPDEVRRRPFSLLFRGPNETLLPQRTYALEHEEMEPMAIFLVPVGQDADGFLYEAIFN